MFPITGSKIVPDILIRPTYGPGSGQFWFMWFTLGLRVSELWPASIWQTGADHPKASSPDEPVWCEQDVGHN